MINVTKFYGVPAWAKNVVSSLTILALVITSMGSLLAFPQDAQAADTGVQYPATVSTNSENPFDNEDWSNLNGITTDGAGEASITTNNFDDNDDSYVLRATNFTVGVPVTATINGILVEIKKDVDAGSAQDGLVQLTKNGTTRVGTNKADTVNNWSNSPTTISYGGASDLWGTTWTPADINATNFGVHFAAEAQSDNTDIDVDFIRVTVYYTPGDVTPPSVTINQAGAQVDPTGTSPINFTVVFSESVSNFATGDVTLSGTAGATTATVTGSGTTYNVAVSGMTTNGTVIASVNAGVATDAAGNANTSGTSSDNQVTFTGLTLPTISATKIVCDSEADLPNMSGGANITASTATNFLNTHPNCHVQSGWVFEWAPSAAANPGDNVGAAGGSWTPFPATNGSGVATAQVPAGSDVWVREQMQASYVPFTGVSGGNVSAEIYCSTDVENYDNYDRINSPAVNATYHCVAFNALPAPKLTVVKTVTNDNGGALGVGDFPLFIDGNPTTSGTPVTVSAGAHTVTETNAAGYAATFGGDCAADGTVTLSAGQNKTCTIVNNDIAPTLSVTKTVTNDNGGVKAIIDFILKIGSSIVTSGVANTLNAGVYTVSEEAAAGYTGTIGGDCASNGSITLAVGENKNCTIVNDDNQPSLTLNKVVIDDNDNNGTTLPSAFTLTATGPTGFSGVGPSVNSSGVTSFDAGTYDLSESGPSGYAASDWVCTGGTQVDADTVTVGIGQNVVCTITNNDIPLPLCSNGTDDDSDGQTDASDPGCWTDINDSGSYNPNGTSEGNESTFATCTDGLDNDGDTLVDLADNNCNAYIPKVVVHKTVINDNLGGTMTPTQFTFDVSNGNSYSNVAFEAEGQQGIKTLELQVGSYSVTEDAVQGYTSTATGDCSGTISTGQTKHCYFTNDDQATTVLVKKTLTQDSGRTENITSFSFKLNGEGSSYFFNEIGEVLLSILPGSYSVLEDASTNAGYTVGYSESCSGSLLLGQTATCTITNDDKPACNDGLDNDNDDFTDANDPGCQVDNGDGGTMYDPNGQSEGDETTLALCKDGVDNDEDEYVDLEDSDCAPFKPVLVVKKELSYEGEIPPTSYGIFSFSINEGDAQAFDSEDGMNTVVLDEAGEYFLEEVNVPQNWDLSSISCVYEDEYSEGQESENGNGYEIYAEAGETVTCTITNVWNPDFDCSDGMDNDGDGNTDASDPGCHLDNDANNPNSYSPTSSTEVNNPGNGGNGGGSGGALPSLFSNGGNGPFVLGASIGPSPTDGAGGVLGETCGLYMDKFLKRAWSKNDIEQVKKLQAFLNKWVGANLPLTGFFGSMTEEAVKAYQASNPDSILKPWNLTSATGLVYITTLRQMNLQECPALSLEIPELTPWTDN